MALPERQRCPLKRLLEAPTDVGLRGIGRMDATRLRPEAGFEEVARLIADFDLLAAPSSTTMTA